MNEAALLLMLLPLIGALFCLFVRFLPRLPLAPAAAGCTVCSMIALLAWLRPRVSCGLALTYAMGGWAEPLGIQLHLDGLAWSSSAMIAWIALAAVLFALGEARCQSDFYFFLLLLVGGMQGVVLTGDLFNMFVFIEIFSIASFILIAYQGKPAGLLASLRYLLLSGASTSFFLIGVFLVYSQTGSLALHLIPDYRQGHAAPVLHLAAAALCIGVGLKAAFVPLHAWLPSAHAAAPHPVSAMLSGVTIKISFLAVWRLIAALGTESFHALFVWIGPATALLGVTFALSQTDGKRLLAWSSISQMGLILASYGAGRAAGLNASLAHMFSHALFKSLLFLSVGAVIHLGGGREVQSGAGRNPQPWLLLFFLIGALSIAGMPPLIGFLSKGLVGSAVKGSALVAWSLRLTAAGTAASMIKLSALFGARGRDRAQPGPRLPLFCMAALALLAASCLASGVFPGRFSRLLLLPALGSAAEMRGYDIGSVVEALLTAAAGFLIYLLIRRRRASLILAWLGSRRLPLQASVVLLILSFLGFAAFGLLS